MNHIGRCLFLVIVVAASATAQTPTGEDLYALVKGIEGRNPEGRREYVLDQLKKLGLSPVKQPFSKDVVYGNKKRTISGENILVSVGKGAKTVVVGAHVDAVPGSPGANDNGGGVAVVLGLLQALNGYPWNHRVIFCFFDQEEAGLIGSQAFVESYGDSLNHLAMINLDVEGMGTDVYVGPVGGGDDEFLMPLVRQAAAITKYKFHESEHYPSSDHLSFARRGLENISISIVPSGDIPLLIKAIAGGWKIDPDQMPQVMRYMHTPEDKSTHVSPQALAMSFEFTKTVLTLLNAEGKN